jgi:hypothetical protein
LATSKARSELRAFFHCSSWAATLVDAVHVASLELLRLRLLGRTLVSSLPKRAWALALE